MIKENISNAELGRKVDMSAGRISDYLNNVEIARFQELLKAKHIGYNEFCRRINISLSCAYPIIY